MDRPDEDLPSEEQPVDDHGAPDDEADADEADAPAAPRRSRAGHVRAVVGLATVLLGLAAIVVGGLVAVAPVEASTTTVTWPRAGSDADRPPSTTAFLVPYRPAELHVDVPCPALREAVRRSGATTVLATTTSDATRGLVVRVNDGTLQLQADGRSRPVTVPSGDCAMRVDADASGLRATVGGRPVLDRPGEPVPEVFAITTDLTGPPAGGLRLRARTPSWFDNAATDEKSDLITLQLQLAAVALGALVIGGVLDRPGSIALSRPDRERLRRHALVGWSRGRRAARRVGSRIVAALRRPWCLLLAAVDVGVVIGLAWWSVVGPMTDDDGFASTIARESATGGPVSNYYRWFDASEAPFASGQQLLAPFLDRGLDPLALRTPSLLAGIALWFLVTRGVLRPALGGRAAAAVGVRLLTVAALAAWWLPFDLGTRPEPLVATGVTAVLVIVLRAVRPQARHPRVLLAVAVGLTAVTVTVAPSGLLGLAPFLLAGPRVGRVVRGGRGGLGDRGGLGGAGRAIETVSVAAGLAGVALVIVFARQSWHGLVVATVVHQEFGPSQPWYAEWLRYAYLLGDDSWGSATKRLPVLLAVVLAVPALTFLARRREALGTRHGETAILLGLAPLGLALLAVTPSKWSHHFGALAGFGAVSLVSVVVVLARAAWEHRPDHALRTVGLVTALGAAAAAAIAFAGPNAWWGYSNAHIPWSTGPVLPVAGLGRWLVVGLVATAAVAVPVVLRRRRSGRPADGRSVVGALAPVALVPLVVVASVGVLVSAFAAAADPPPGAWSPGARNLAVARDPGTPAGCGLEDRVQVLTTARGGPLAPATDPGDPPAALDGFVAQDGWDDAPPARPGDDDDTRDGRYAWGSKTGGEANVGALTSQWFVLPRPRDAQELAVSVAGRTSDGASVTLEYGRSGRGGVAPIDQRRMTEPTAPEHGYRGYAATADRARLQDDTRDLGSWRTLTVPAADIPPGVDRVRVLARDDRTDAQGWVAVTGPRVVDVTPLRRYLAERTPVVVDWAVAFAWPCVDDPAPVGDGRAATPRALITTPRTTDPLPGQRTVDDAVPDDVVPERWTTDTELLITSPDTGGSFAGMRQAADLEEVDTRLAGDPGRVWGRLLVPDYRGLERDEYDTRRVTTRIAGTAGDPAPTRDPQARPDDPDYGARSGPP